ncbi:MAG: histidine phosphatase family protein [Oscillospiraceae bacterium]|nr:histidine phosphatase family protein [Oscillospiraceae bacterium]
MKIFAALHGQTDIDAEGRLQSVSDNPLNDIGRAQALEIAKAVASSGIEVIMSSPESRSTETAEIIAEHLGIDDSKVAKGVKLNERDYGDLEGKLISEVDIFALSCWEINASPPNGEEIRDTAVRVMTYMTDVVEIFKGMTILLIVPGNVLRTLFWYFEGLPDYNKDPFFKYDFATLYEFDTDKMPQETMDFDALISKLDPEGKAGKIHRDAVLSQSEIDSLINEMGITLD